MSAPPPVPPRPLESHSSNSSLPPPVPPLPPDFRPSPLPAPTPHRFDPNIAFSLDHEAIPGPSPRPPNWQPWNPSLPPSLVTQPFVPAPASSLPYSSDTRDHLVPAVPIQNAQFRPTSASPGHYPSRVSQSSPQRPPGPPSLVSPMPSIQNLAAALPTIQQPSHDSALKITWCRDVFFLVDRLQQNTSPDSLVGPARIPDPQLARIVQIAVPIVLQIAATQPLPNPVPRHIAEAIYLRASFTTSGAFPEFVQHNPRSAFRDFEQAAKAGFAQAWFKLGTDYENFSDVSHARDCFERGVKLGVESCIYRMGMAHLLGQLGLSPSYEQSVPLLHRAATLASLDTPQPAYVYGLLLLGEFSYATIPPRYFTPFIPSNSNPPQEARKYLERAAFLNFAPAQYKLGHAYELAMPPFPFDPLLSVQYYSLASQQGEIEADMALSKWFLCGAEGAFEKDEILALTFAEKAARKNLPTAEFAMGYYTEVGVGCPKDMEVARRWYVKASEHGNMDAIERLQALNQAQPKPLSRKEHDTITENKLVRRRTLARQRSEANYSTGVAQPGPLINAGDGQHIVEVIRKNSFSTYETLVDHPPHHANRLQTMPEHSVPLTHARNSSAPTMPASPRPRPAQPNASRPLNRYTLSDDPRQQPPLQPGRILTSSPTSNVEPGSQEGGAKPTQRPGGKGPSTFAEMGFQSARAEDKDCVIM